MKKLLAFLGIISLATPTSVAVACGKLPQKENQSVQITQSLIDEYKADLSKIISEHIKTKKDNLTQLFSAKDDDFFTMENMKKYGYLNGSNSEPEKLSSSQLEQIKQHFNQLMDVKGLGEKLQKLASTTDKYEFIIVNNQPVESVGFNIEKLKISYLENVSGMEGVFISQTKIALEVKYQYYDFDRMVVTKSMPTDIILTNSNNKDFLEILSQLQNDIWEDLLRKNSELVWINKSKLGYSNTDLHKIFELYNQSERYKKFASYVGTIDFARELNNEVNDLIQSSATQLDIELAYDFGEAEIIDDDLTNMLEPKITQGIIASELGTSDESVIRKALLRSAVEDGKEVRFEYTNHIKKVNDGIYELLNKTMSQTILSYRDSLEETFINQFNYKPLQAVIQKDTFMQGYLNIGGVKVRLGGTDFTLEINPIMFAYTVNVDNNKIIADSEMKKSVLGEAVYENTFRGIVAMQQNLGFEDSTRTMNTDSNTHVETPVPIAMTGNRKNSPLSVNLWDKFEESIAPIEKPNSVARFNEVMSLKLNDLAPVRYNLLREGFQNSFEMSLVYFDFDNNQKVVEYNIGDPKRTFSLYSAGWRTKTITASTDNVHRIVVTGIRIKMNLIDVAIGLEEFNNKTTPNSGENLTNGTQSFFLIEKIRSKTS